MEFPEFKIANKLGINKENRLFIGAYGFEERSLGWVNYQKEQGTLLNSALMIKYENPKGKNLIDDHCRLLKALGISIPKDIPYNTLSPHNFESLILCELENKLSNVEEVIIDISAMTKLLILVCLCMLKNYSGIVRIVYAEAADYAPNQDEYEKSKNDMEMLAKFPSRNVESIIGTKCLSSIRMQGQPVTIIAFTSFNEQLVRHMLGTICPHRLLFINGRPQRKDYAWREIATQEIHKKLIDEYAIDNPINNKGLLENVVSTLDYRETACKIDEIYKDIGNYSRIICAATGSKMQTVGLFFSKIQHPDIHIEYPTPDSYFVKRLSTGVREIHEILIPNFSNFLNVSKTSEISLMR